MDLLGYKIYTDYPNLAYTAQVVINTMNPHSFCIAKKDFLFNEAILNSDILLPDGFGIVLAARILNSKKIERITGSDIHKYMLDDANRKHLKVFYLGSADTTLKKIEERISKEYPDVTVKTFSPPFRELFSEDDNNVIFNEINSFMPDYLFVGMTAPKQEKWIYKNKQFLNASVICAIGAVFDFYAGTVKRSGKFWISIGLEWLPRLIREPRRLWRRTLISTPQFLGYVIAQKLKNLIRITS